MKNVRILTVNELPQETDVHTVYILPPQDFSESYYRERTDRNIGWITREEQELLHNATVGIAGCGGMGGLIAATLVRLGVGTIKIADCEEFDISNINRQFGANRETVGVSKAFATARMLRSIANDTSLVVYPQGINEDTVEHFLSDCDVVCDMIEFWAIGARLLLHHRAKKIATPLFNFNTVGMSTFLFNFDHTGMSLAEALGFDHTEAYILQNNIQNNTASQHEIARAAEAVNRIFLPIIPDYVGNSTYNTQSAFHERLNVEQKASIFGTNPPMSVGIGCNHIALFLIHNSHVQRSNIVRPPSFAGYMHFDAAQWTTNLVTKTWWL